MAAADAANAAMLAGTVGSGLLGGLYFIFSFCVMQALNTQPPATAIHVMNSINEVERALALLHSRERRAGEGRAAKARRLRFAASAFRDHRLVHRARRRRR
mmetsp:Transcript_23629/g.70629  ORF Transcript_23629/g.70629 Transcript_23629/m.70629 type:complete len:101 (+) Transcript_23629:189-491(+)